MIPYHRIAARLYNKPTLLAPDALTAASDFLLSRIDQRVDRVEISDTTTGKKVNQFVGTSRTDDGVYHPYRVSNGVAIISILGELVNRSIGLADADCGLVSYEFIQHQLASADKDAGVRAIVFDLDSPGGEASGCFSLADFIRDVRTRKPVVACPNSLAASGGYVIAAAASAIVIPRDSEVGSIGAWMLHFNLAAHFEQQGVKPTLLWKGARKVDGNPFGPLSPEAAARFDDDLDRIYSMFVASVAAGRRNLSEDAIRGTEAGMFFAEDALKLGLVDRVGSFADAMALATSMANGSVAIASSNRSMIKAPTLLAATGKSKQKPTASAKGMEVSTMENCANENCGHPHDQHPDDGACTADGCACTAYAAPVAEGTDQSAAPEGARAQVSASLTGGGSRALADETIEQRLARLEQENASLKSDNQAQAHQRIAAEVKAFIGPLTAKDDLRFNVQSVLAMAQLLLIGKCAAVGLPSVEIERDGKVQTHALDVKAVGELIVLHVETMAKIGAKFDVPGGELPAPKGGAIAGVTVADFTKAATDNEAANRIDSAVRARRKELKNAKYSKDDLYRELAAN
jgi:signal peptide peptidase SppA